jgi:primosomal replication protein N
VVCSVNRTVLLGVVSKYGVKLHTSPSGTPHATFHLVVTEQTADGKYFSTLIPCEVWGKKAPAAAAIASNTTVLFEGKISRRKRDETWELCVSGFELTPLTPTPQEVSA